MPNIIKSTQYNKDIIRTAPKNNDMPVSRSTLISEEQRRIELQQNHDEIISQALKKANSILEAAHHDSLNMKQEIEAAALKKSEQLQARSQKEGYESGFALGKKEGLPIGFNEGYEEGLSRGRNETLYLLNSFEEMVETFKKEKEEIMQSFKDGLDDLVFKIAKAVLKKEVELNPETLVELAHNAIGEYKEQAWIKIYVSDKNLQTLLQSKPEFVKSLKDNVRLIADSNMQDSDCLCETPVQAIDVGIDSQFNNIQQAFLNDESNAND